MWHPIQIQIHRQLLRLPLLLGLLLLRDLEDLVGSTVDKLFLCGVLAAKLGLVGEVEVEPGAAEDGSKQDEGREEREGGGKGLAGFAGRGGRLKEGRDMRYVRSSDKSSFSNGWERELRDESESAFLQTRSLADESKEEGRLTMIGRDGSRVHDERV
jgi:hypothetical protein